MGQLSRLLRFSGKFLADRRYRNHVLGVIERHVKAGDASPLPANESLASGSSWLAGRKVYLVGGCELTYLKDSLEKTGVEAHHTFDHGGAPEPFAETANPGSALWSFEPDVIVLSQVQLYRGLVQKVQVHGLESSREELEDALKELLESAAQAIQKIRERFACPIFLMTYPLVYRPAYGIHEYRSLTKGYGLIELWRSYELKVYELARRFPSTYVLDVNLAFEKGGKEGAINEAGADGVYEHFTREGAAKVAERLVYQLEVLEPKRRRVKCAVVDLDNTLWNGVLREDGPGGVAVRLSALTALDHLTRRGIILAVCSKNDEVEVEHLPSLLGDNLWGKVVARRLNWKPKSENLRELAKELNIGLDSLAFFDDNPFEREEVRTNAPEVLVLKDTDILESLQRPEFEPFGEVTAEASSRTAKYTQQTKREEAAAEAAASGSTGSMEAFLKSCQLRLSLRRPAEGEMSRVHELLQRTNQLNATMRRSSQADLQGYWRAADNFETCVALLEDKFGDYGLIGLGIARKNGKDWEVMELAFSCRAMGKGVEEALVLDLAQRASRSGAAGLAIEYQRTDRNQQLLSILQGLQFGGDVPDVGAKSRLFRPNRPEDAGAFPSWLEIRR
jgi:FkbH-like protein